MTHLECSLTGERYDSDRIQNLSKAGKPLLARYDLEAAASRLSGEEISRRPAGMWKWRELLPLPEGAEPVSLGEPETPLIPLDGVGLRQGTRAPIVKDEGRLPTGSFKARGMAAAVSMTNSRLTDPEILETRMPVRLEQFSIRLGSGGAGAHRGGDGVVREVTFLEPMRANILANRRCVPPSGIKGGADGQAGRNWVERTDGSVEMLSATASADIQPGDRFVVETPGGGGYGSEPCREA